MLPVEAAIGGHHAGCAAFLDRALEGAQVHLAQGAFVEIGADAVPVIFLVVGGEVLDGGGNLAALQAANVGGRELAGKFGIFAEIFKVSPTKGGAIQVHTRREQNMHAHRAAVVSQRRAISMGQFRIHGGGQADQRRIAGRCFCPPMHANRSVGKFQRRQPDSGYAIRIAIASRTGSPVAAQQQ